MHTLKGHKNAVYALSFNLPYGDKIATGSFDTYAKVIQDYYINISFNKIIKIKSCGIQIQEKSFLHIKVILQK